MSILVGADTKVLVQGITGRLARAHTQQMLAYGTQIVGGVVPGKGGETVEGVPVFNTVEEAVAATDAQASIVFVPAPSAADAMMEAADAGIRYCVCITEGIPAQDMIRVKRYMYRYPRERRMVLTGPNCPGTISPDQALLGVMPPALFESGPIGLVSRSGTLGYEAASQLASAGLGISTMVGIGADPINGSSFRDLLEQFERDDDTKLIVIIGASGGPQEAEAAAYVRDHMTKPVVAYLARMPEAAPQHMGHAGAIISAFGKDEQTERDVFAASGIVLAKAATEIGTTVSHAIDVFSVD